MQKKKILYLVTFIITLFSFTTTANAAQELTCVYKKSGFEKKLKVIQDKSGKLYAYLNDKDVQANDAGWEKVENLEFDYYFLTGTGAGEYVYNLENHLTKCPPYAEADGNPDKNVKVTLYNTSGLFANELDINDSTKIMNVPDPYEEATNGPLYDVTKDSRYTGACKYAVMTNGKNHYVQINFGNENFSFVEYDAVKGFYSSKNFKSKALNTNFSFYAEKDFNLEYFLKNGGNCLDEIYVRKIVLGPSTMGVSTTPSYITTIVTKETAKSLSDARAYILDKGYGKNPITGEPLGNDTKYDNEISFGDFNIKSCADLVGAKGAEYINLIWSIVKFGVPIILLGLGTADFVPVIFAGKEDAMKKAQDKFIKRVIIALSIFLIPTVLTFLLKIANEIWGIGTDLCGIIF